MILLALSLTSKHTPTAWMISASIPNPVPGPGNFKRALPGHFCQAPKRGTLVHLKSSLAVALRAASTDPCPPTLHRPRARWCSN
jgi:hypothetical protein